jgi:hypothetical protein
MTSDAHDDQRCEKTDSIFSLAELIPTNRLLYYPCSGLDTRFPLERFADSIDSFWFADMRYVKDLRKPIEDFVIHCPSGYTLEARTKLIVHPASRDPYIALRCQLRHRESRRQIEVLYLANDAVGVFQALEKADKKLAVFFYRRDGVSEGGSNLWWLHPTPALDGVPAFLERVLGIIEPGGKIVSDGSNALEEFVEKQPNGSSGNNKLVGFDCKQWRLHPDGPIDPQCDRTMIWSVSLVP